MALSQNQQTFRTIFLAITGLVGIVLAVLNMNESRSTALVFAVVGVASLIAALATRKKADF